jgi:surfactin synthase thioesterase subunit
MLGFAAAWSKRLRVYNVDLIGEPGLSAPSRPMMGSEAYALWLDDVLDALGLEKTAMLGISLGGWFALDYASRRPERLTRLVLLAPCGLGRLKMGPLIRFLLLPPFGDPGRRKAMKAAIGPMEAGWDDPEMGEFTLVVFKAFRPRLEIPTFGDETPGKLTMPVLVSVGEQDWMLDSPGTKQRFEEVVPQAKVRVLPGVGHLVTDAVELGEFLDQDGRHPRRAGPAVRPGRTEAEQRPRRRRPGCGSPSARTSSTRPIEGVRSGLWPTAWSSKSGSQISRPLRSRTPAGQSLLSPAGPLDTSTVDNTAAQADVVGDNNARSGAEYRSRYSKLPTEDARRSRSRTRSAGASQRFPVDQSVSSHTLSAELAAR